MNTANEKHFDSSKKFFQEENHDHAGLQCNSRISHESTEVVRFPEGSYEYDLSPYITDQPSDTVQEAWLI